LQRLFNEKRKENKMVDYITIIGGGLAGIK